MEGRWLLVLMGGQWLQLQAGCQHPLASWFSPLSSLPLLSALLLSIPRSPSAPNASFALCSLTSDPNRLSVSSSVCMCVCASPLLDPGSCCRFQRFILKSVKVISSPSGTWWLVQEVLCRHVGTFIESSADSRKTFSHLRAPSCISSQTPGYQKGMFATLSCVQPNYQFTDPLPF